ncbi:MAG: hypothetical protein WC729_19085 [Sphingomonas sp.]|jgi:hypothetical protein|uniref:hypothetical protein n=1 Tax=Sphingomonas sp. TaxID=28214 RepID=UPI003569C20C
MTLLETQRETRLAYAVEGLPDHQELAVHTDQTALEILDLIKAKHPELAVSELIVEDEEESLDGDFRIVEQLEIEFKLVHAGRGGRIDVLIHYDGDERKHSFRASATVRKIIKWAISGDGFDLVDPASKFVLKLGEKELNPELHLGQINDGKRKVELTLVHTRKIQG